MTARVLTLCADDFGLAPGITRGIQALAHAQRLSAISCTTSSPYWREAAPLLRSLPEGLCVGLHFNLSQGKPLSAELARVWPELPSVPRLTVLAQLHRLPLRELRFEWLAQLDAFAQATGRAPHMVAGHGDVHRLPGVRQVVLDGIAPFAPRPAVRSTARLLGPRFAFKRWVMGHTGGRALQRDITKLGLRHNACLAGVYDFTEPDYRALVRQWLALLPREGGLLACQPAEVADAGDPLGDTRLREFAYFESDAFTRDLAEAQVTLGQAWVRAQRA